MRVRVVGLIAGLLLVWPAAASASGWSIAPSPNPSGSADPEFNGVSCPTRRACTAVGEYFTSSGLTLTLAERWNGSTWRIQPTANPPGASSTYLFAVSCRTTRFCLAVGQTSLTSTSSPVTFAERWDGVSWRVVSTPNPVGGLDSSLRGVSCTTRRACTAVGFDYNSSEFPVSQAPLAERWNGTAWTIEPTVNQPGATDMMFNGVSCPSRQACVAVGDYFTFAAPTFPLAERWNGTSWQLQSAPNPPSTGSGVPTTSLGGVSCPTPQVCTAVGQYGTPSTPNSTLAERWAAGSWEIQPTPTPLGTTAPYVLNGVSCPTKRVCVAIGSAAPASGPSFSAGLALRWNGTTWRTQSIPDPAGAPIVQLEGVSCARPSRCLTAGYYEPTIPHAVTLTERYVGPG